MKPLAPPPEEWPPELLLEEELELKIFERNLVSAFQKLIRAAPPSHEALIIFIGDNTHSDGQTNTTTKGTRVDVDGRSILMMRTIISAARTAIDLALDGDLAFQPLAHLDKPGELAVALEWVTGLLANERVNPQNRRLLVATSPVVQGDSEPAAVH